MKSMMPYGITGLERVNLGAKWWFVVNATLRLLYPRARDAIPVLQESLWATGLV